MLKIYITKRFSNNYKKENTNKISKKDFENMGIDASHHMGGTIYNKNRKFAFVDNNLKILGLKKTFICSSSVFPTSGFESPTIIIIALAKRLAYFLISKQNK